jgi:hypothetical protein
MSILELNNVKKEYRLGETEWLDGSRFVRYHY